MDAVDADIRKLAKDYPYAMAQVLTVERLNEEQAEARLQEVVDKLRRGKSRAQAAAAVHTHLTKADEMARAKGVSLDPLRILRPRPTRSDEKAAVAGVRGNLDRPSTLSGQKDFVARLLPGREKKNGRASSASGGGGGNKGGAWVGTDTMEPPSGGGMSRGMKTLMVVGIVIMVAMLVMGALSTARSLGWEPGWRQEQPLDIGSRRVKQTSDQDCNLEVLQEKVAESYREDVRKAISMMAEVDRPKLQGKSSVQALAQRNKEGALDWWGGKAQCASLASSETPEKNILDLITGESGTLETLLAIGEALAQNPPDWTKAKAEAANYEKLDSQIRQLMKTEEINVEGDPLEVVSIIEKWEKNLGKSSETPEATEPALPNEPSQPSSPGQPSSQTGPNEPLKATPTPFLEPAQATPTPPGLTLYHYGGLDYEELGARGVIQGYLNQFGPPSKGQIDQVLAWARANGGGLDGFEEQFNPQKATIPTPAGTTPTQVYTYLGRDFDPENTRAIIKVNLDASGGCGTSVDKVLTWAQGRENNINGFWNEFCGSVVTVPTPVPTLAAVSSYTWNNRSLSEEDARATVTQYMRGLPGRPDQDPSKVQAVLDWATWANGGGLDGFEAWVKSQWYRPTPVPQSIPGPVRQPPANSYEPVPTPVVWPTPVPRPDQAGQDYDALRYMLDSGLSGCYAGQGTLNCGNQGTYNAPSGLDGFVGPVECTPGTAGCYEFHHGTQTKYFTLGNK